MAEIHPDIRGLLNALSASGFTQLVQLCLEQIERKDQPQTPDDAGSNPSARRRILREQLRFRALNQLSIIDGVVSGSIEEELKLIAGLRMMAETLAIKNVSLLPPPTELPETASAGGNFEQLLSRDRESSIRKFLSTWAEVMGEARSRLGVG